MQLLDVADVERGDGHWSAGYQFDAIGCVLYSVVSANCAPVRNLLTGNDDETATSSGRDAYPFAVITSFRGRAMCSDGQEPKIVEDALEAETEKAVGKFLFDGNGGDADVFLNGPDGAVQSVDPTDPVTAIASVLDKFWSIATGIEQKDTILHLGIQSALAAKNLIDDGIVYGTDVKVSVSPGYPKDAIAVTGPVTIKIGSNQVVSVPNTAVNDLNNEAIRLVSVEYDPCISVLGVTAP